jgi:hypothetical protein
MINYFLYCALFYSFKCDFKSWYSVQSLILSSVENKRSKLLALCLNRDYLGRYIPNAPPRIE